VRGFCIPLLLVCLLGASPLQSCKRKAVPRSASEESQTHETELSSGTTRRVLAAWYRVPPESLAKRRAGADDYTAAHNKLALGTRVRVTNPDNDQTVIVRITDRGIHDRRVKIDVCKEAAEELGIVREGFAQLKMEVLSDEPELASGEATGVRAGQ